MAKVTIVTPQTLEELEAHRVDIEKVAKYAKWVDDPMQLAADELTYLSLLYVNGAVFGLVVIHAYLNKRPGDKSAHIAGVFRQDLRAANKAAYNRGAREVTHSVLTHLFKTLRIDKVICKPQKASRAGRGFAIMNGFKLINTEKDCHVYKLTYKQWKARHGVS